MYMCMHVHCIVHYVHVLVPFCRHCSSTNLTELAKAARILATLNSNDLEGDDLLKAARALAAATAALLNAAAPENIEVGFNWNGSLGSSRYCLNGTFSVLCPLTCECGHTLCKVSVCVIQSAAELDMHVITVAPWKFNPMSSLIKIP